MTENDNDLIVKNAKKKLALGIAITITSVIFIFWIIDFSSKAEKILSETSSERGQFFGSIKKDFTSSVGNVPDIKKEIQEIGKKIVEINSLASTSSSTDKK